MQTHDLLLMEEIFLALLELSLEAVFLSGAVVAGFGSIAGQMMVLRSFNCILRAGRRLIGITKIKRQRS